MTAEAAAAGFVLVEVLDRHGRGMFRERFALDDGGRRLTFGRSLSADIVLDDVHTAPLHVAVAISPDGRLRATDLGSVNGIVVNGRRHRGARDLEFDGATLQLGATRLRIRTTLDQLAPEVPEMRPLDALVRHPVWIAAVAGAIASADMAYESWLSAPQDLTDTLVTALAAMAAITVLWTSVWALLSRVMVGEWRWFVHAAIMLAIGIVYSIVDGVINVGLFSLAIPAWESQTAWLMAVTLAAGLYLHLTRSSSLAPRRAAVAAMLAPALIVGGGMWFFERSAARDVNRVAEPARIYPAAFRLAGASDLEAYVAGLAKLHIVADEKRRVAIAEDPDGSGDE